MKTLSVIRRSRYARLLPSVMLVCGGLLVLKTSGLVHEALAQAAAPAPADALAPAPKPGNKDFAGEDSEIASAAEVDVLTSLSKRRGELDAREAQIQVQANMLAATESRVDTKITQLKQLQDKIASLLAQRDDAQQKQVLSLVKTYTAMGKKAGPIFAGLSDDVAVPVAQAMKPEDLSTLMQAMPPDAAQKLTMKLASKLTLPDTTNALAPPPAPVAVPPAPAAQATPAAPPAQTASATPAPAAPAPAAPAPKPGT